MDTEIKKEKKAIQVLRDKRGGMTDEFKEYYKEQNRIRKLLKEALKQGPRIIPELAMQCNLDPADTTWHIMAMRKYGEVVDDEIRGDYYSYRLKEVK